jgi:hypothetical protein
LLIPVFIPHLIAFFRKFTAHFLVSPLPRQNATAANFVLRASGRTGSLVTQTHESKTRAILGLSDGGIQIDWYLKQGTSHSNTHFSRC